MPCEQLKLKGTQIMKVVKNACFSGGQLKKMKNAGFAKSSRSAILLSSFCILNTFLVSTLWGGVVATGGNVKRIHNDYIHTFTESGTFTVVKPGTVQVLVVGGGGGGGCSPYGGGGGGAGGVVYNESFAVDVGSYSVIVGVGGTGAKTSFANAAGVGGYSAFSNLVANVGITAKGGGRGGSNKAAGGSGGCGGGGAGSSALSTTYAGGAGTVGQGCNGGRGQGNNANDGYAGGGGGAASVGCSVDLSNSANRIYGIGGEAFACSISGSEKLYGEGGSGGASSIGSGVALYRPTKLGGEGGKYSTSGPTAGKNGVNGTGSGGGGGGGNRSTSGAAGGNGGSGIVIVRCKHSQDGFFLFVR
jgi:hypothetical protein